MVYLDRFYLCLFIGIIDYLIFGILNDSLVLVSPYFYIVLSILCSKMLKKNHSFLFNLKKIVKSVTIMKLRWLL